MTCYRRLRAADRRSQRWKNGGGETSEVIASPADAGDGEFDWRISIASVTQAGLFSIFPGVHRTLTVIDGRLEQTFEDEGCPRILDGESEPFAFPGDVPVRGRPVDAPVRNVNIMTREGRFTGRVTRLALPGVAMLDRPPKGIAVLLALEQAQVDLGEGPMALDPLDAITMRAPAGLLKVTGGRLLLAAICPS